MKTRSMHLIIVIWSLIPTQGWCWSELGHSIIGAVAEERMAPETKSYIEGIMGIESAALSANWADAVRDDPRFNHDPNEHDQAKRDLDNHNFSDYHFTDIPTGYQYDNRPNEDVKDSFGGISGALEILKCVTCPYRKAERIIALRYLIHLIGDIHQPLHVGNGYDVGANFCSVLWMTENSPRNLHSIWDDEMVRALGPTLIDPASPNSKSPFYYPQYIDAFKKLRSAQFNAPKPSDVSPAAIKGWINDSAAIRESTVYPDAPGSMSGIADKERYKHRAYCMWLADKNKNIFGDTSAKKAKDIPLNVLPRLNSSYVSTNLAIVERQLIQGGIRLAAILDDLAKNDLANRRRLKPITIQVEDDILTSLQNIFHNPIQPQ